jgi:hypothetical protein
LNGIFSSLEPLEDPKDDMFFFGGKDLLQKARDKNPANNTLTIHKPNKPAPPLSVYNNTLNGANVSHTMVPTAKCDPQPSINIPHPNKPLTTNEAKNMSPAAIASASASAMYLDNFLAASNNNPTYKPPSTLTAVPPPLPTHVHDRPTKSILKRSTQKAHRGTLSKSQPVFSYSSLAQNQGAQTKIADSAPLQSIINNLSLSTSIIGPPTTQTLTPTSLTPTVAAQNSNPTNFTNLSNSTYTPAQGVPTKRSRSGYTKSTNELKQSRIIYNPNIINNNTKINSSNINNVNNNDNNINNNINNNVNNNMSSINNANSNINNNNVLHNSSEISSSGGISTISMAPHNNNVLATSGHITRPPTAEAPENVPDRNNYQSNSTSNYNNNFDNIKPENNSHRMSAGEYMTYGAINPYFAYPVGLVHPFYASTAQMAGDNSMVYPEPGYNPRGSEQQYSTEAQPTNVNPSNDLYSNLYLYSFNNSIYNSNNNTTTYSRTTPNPDISAAYDLYSYNNLYLNNMYSGYPSRQYTTASTYHSHKSASSYDSQAYRNGNDSFDENDDDEDYRAERSHSKSFSKRSKRRSGDDDEYRKPSRKSKSRRSKRSKQLSPLYTEPMRGSAELHATSSEIPKGEGASPAAFTPPLSPALGTKRAKASANLFENTPKIKIGEAQGGNAKISKLGKKMLEAVNLDWHTPYESQSAPAEKLAEEKLAENLPTENLPMEKLPAENSTTRANQDQSSDLRARHQG